MFGTMTPWQQQAGPIGIGGLPGQYGQFGQPGQYGGGQGYWPQINGALGPLAVQPLAAACLAAQAAFVGVLGQYNQALTGGWPGQHQLAGPQQLGLGFAPYGLPPQLGQQGLGQFPFSPQSAFGGAFGQRGFGGQSGNPLQFQSIPQLSYAG
jgi:hypothetical protein